MTLIEIVHELRSAKGSKAKIKILEQHKDNKMWLKFLVYTYDERTSYGVSSPASLDFDPVPISDHMFEQFDDLAERKVTGNAAKALTKMLSSAYGEIPRLVLGRSIKAGISVKTINKVYPDLIHTFETMKGVDVPFKDFPLFSSIKFDGNKVFVWVAPNKVEMMTSSGTKFSWPALELEFKSAMYGMYEGEMTHRLGKLKDRPVITGKMNSLLAGSSPDMSFCYYRIYDWIPMSEWSTRAGYMKFIDRYKALEAQFSVGFGDSAIARRVEQYVMTTKAEAEKFYEHYIEQGFEGTMSRYSEDVYEWTGDKRTERLIKKKSIRKCILQCVGTTPHSNPEKGIVGSLLLEGTIEDKFAGKVRVQVSTGSGLSKFDINCDPDRYIGEDIEMMYNSVTTTDKGHSLFLPRFKRVVK